MVDLSLDGKSVETSFTFKANDSILKYPLLDYGIASAKNIKINPSPKMMDQSKFALESIGTRSTDGTEGLVVVIW